MALLLPAGVAVAAPQRGIGFETAAQPYRGNPDKTDWIGSYIVNGQQDFCVQFAFLAPDSDEVYQKGQALMTKWGTALDPTVAAEISYLLLRYAATTSPDEASALAFLLHSWTAAPTPDHTTDPANDFRHIAYDAPFHLTRLPASAQAAVDRLRADAATNHGPWKLPTITAPATPQIIGAPAAWLVTVHNANDKGLAKVPVHVTVTDGTLADGKTTGVINTPATGADLSIPVTPTGANPTVQIAVDTPADRPVVQEAIQVDTQRIVSTGGENHLTVNAATTASTAPGKIQVAKTNAKTGEPIAGVSLRLTKSDRTKPADDQENKPLVGPDGKPIVVVTGPDGTVLVPNIKTPQDVCVIEVSPPPGFTDAFDPAAPPAACGTVTAGDTLALALANKPNAPPVPIKIAAGDQPVPVAMGVVSQVTGPVAVFVLCGIVLLATGLGGFFVRRRIVRRR